MILRPTTVRKRIRNCCFLNGGVFWASILFFDYCLRPAVLFLVHWFYTFTNDDPTNVLMYVHTLLSVTFGMFWVLPLFVLTRCVNNLWFQVIVID